jgi:pimeloyl-ACP methyl ester carboxylesterase
VAFGEHCSIDLAKEVNDLIKGLETDELIFAGHSLGGTAAMCLALAYPESRAVVLNGGAPPTNPILKGAPSRINWYHIVGDLISSHISPQAANVTRVSMGDDSFSVTWPHSTARFFEKGKIVDADYEDRIWEKFSTPIVTGKQAAVISFMAWLKSKQLAKKAPIPGSLRWKKMQ